MNLSDEEQQLYELSNFNGSSLGLDDDIMIFIGPTINVSHGARIKVSNNSKMNRCNDCFVITVPDMKIVGEINTKHINNKKLKKIKEFIELNETNIIDFCNAEKDVVGFITDLIKIKEENNE